MIRKILSTVILTLVSATLQAAQPEPGYRGFVDLMADFRKPPLVGAYRIDTWNLGISTTHGWQINPKFFIGAGFSALKYSRESRCILPIYLDGRYDMKFGIFTPFAEVRFGYHWDIDGFEKYYYHGYQTSDINKGLFFSPSIGYRFNWGRKVGLNVGIGWSLYRQKGLDGYIDEVEQNGYKYWDFIPTGWMHYTISYLNLRVGIDF